MDKKIKEKADFIYQEISKKYPNAKCELHYTNPLELLISIMLSAQTTDQAVNQVTTKLYQKFLVIDDYITVPIEELENDLRQLGLYKNKAKNIKATCALIKNKYQGIIENDQLILESFPGVGKKTANVFLAEMFHEPRIAVDTHVSRVSIRLGLADESDSVFVIEKKLMSIYDQKIWISLHHKFIFFGRYFCKSRNPHCKECPLVKVCLKPIL